MNAEGECVIYVKYTHDQNYTLFSTGEKINPVHWDAKGQQVRQDYRGFTTLNDTLDVKKNEIKEIARIAKQNKLKPTLGYVKSVLAKAKPQLPEVNKDFVALFERFIQDTSSAKVHGTNKHYKTALNHLRNFAEQKKFKLSLEKMNPEFYDKYLNYLTNDKRMSGGAINNQIKKLKVFLGYFYERGIHTDLTFKKFML